VRKGIIDFNMLFPSVFILISFFTETCDFVLQPVHCMLLFLLLRDLRSAASAAAANNVFCS
jgi:hypothetical protein